MSYGASDFVSEIEDMRPPLEYTIDLSSLQSFPLFCKSFNLFLAVIATPFLCWVLRRVILGKVTPRHKAIRHGRKLSFLLLF